MRSIKDIFELRDYQLLNKLNFGKRSGKYLYEVYQEIASGLLKSKSDKSRDEARIVMDKGERSKALALKKRNSMPYRLTISQDLPGDLWPHQSDILRKIATLDLLRHDKGVAVFFKQALGKTRTAGEIIRLTDAPSVLIVCPAPIKMQWKIEAEKFTGRRFEILPDWQAAKKKSLLAQHRFVITNYETFLNPDLCDLIALNNYSLVILDESQRIKNYTSKTTQNLTAVVQHCGPVVVMSGTPATKVEQAGCIISEDLWPQMFVIGCEDFGRNISAFRSRFMDTKVSYTGRYEHSPKLQMEAEYRAIIERHGSIVQKSAAITTKGVIIDRYVDLSNEELKIYKQMATGMIPLGENAGQEIIHYVAIRAKLLQIASGTFEGNVLHERKIEMAREIFDEDEDEKLIIFTRHNAEVEMVEKFFNDVGVVTLTGATKNKQQAVDEFIRGNKKILAANVQAGGVGIDGLQNAARRCLFFCLPDRWGDFDQAMHRLIRPGQKSPDVLIYRLIASGTVDEAVAQSIDMKDDSIAIKFLQREAMARA